MPTQFSKDDGILGSIFVRCTCGNPHMSYCQCYGNRGILSVSISGLSMDRSEVFIQGPCPFGFPEIILTAAHISLYGLYHQNLHAGELVR